MGTFEVALLVALSLGVVTFCTYVISGVWTPLLTGLIAGIFLGDIALGLKIGGICSLMSLGFYTYGGAVTPNYGLGAAIGVAVAIKSGDYNQGIVIGSVIALLGTWFDILQGLIATYFMHKGEKCLEKRNCKGFERWHVNGIWVIIATNVIPVFVGMMLIDQYTVISDFVDKYSWVESGLTVIGSLLPAVGFALLLSYMEIKKYWPFMIIGYVLFAYMNVPTLGLALVGTAAGYLYCFANKGKKQIEESEVA